MRNFFRGVRLMLALSFGADAWRTVAALVTTVGQMGTFPFRALGLKLFVDGVTGHDRRLAIVGALVVAGIAAAGRIFAWASFNVRMRLRENTQLYLDAQLMALTAGIPGIEHHERPEYLDKVELIRSEREALANPFNPISWTVASVVQAVAVIGILVGVHPLLALMPIFGVATLAVSLLQQRAQAKLREAQTEPQRMQRHLMELTTEVEAAKEIRIFGLADELVDRHRRLFDELERGQVRLALRWTGATALAWIVFAAGYLAGVGLAVHLALTAQASAGAVVLVLFVGGQLNQQLAELSGNVGWFVRTQRAIQRYLWLVDHAAQAKARVAPKDPLPPPARLARGIELSGVSFTYPGTDRPVLENVDLVLPAGATVAIVGDNGAGKTTLVKLLCRFYEPTSGAISIDGIPLARIPIDDWRARIAAGFQDFARIELFARESIGTGDLARLADDGAILSALDRAAASDVPSVLPRGLDTQLGKSFEGGVDLSQGQWQKIALGRAMMREAPLLVVLDEPTASLDAPTEHALFERFAGAARRSADHTGAITLLVSHRFSTVRMADLILVVAGGRIAEAGDHATLVRAGGLYAELYELQSRAYR